MLAQPVDQPVHRLDPAGFGIAEILLRPARDLAFDEAGRPAVIAKADRLRIEAVQRGDRSVHRIERGRAIVAAQAGKPRFPEDPPFDHVHHKERRADDAVVVAKRMDPRRWKLLAAERVEHTIFAIDGMGAGQQLARRLAAKNIGAAGRIDPIGRVRLPALELADPDRAAEARHMGSQPRFQRRLVEAEPLADRAGAGVGFGAVHFVHIYR